MPEITRQRGIQPGPFPVTARLLWVMSMLSGYLWVLATYWIVDTSMPGVGLIHLSIGVLGGMTITATAQALILRHNVRAFPWRRWVVLTVSGYILGLFIVTFSLYSHLSLLTFDETVGVLDNMVVVPDMERGYQAFYLVLNVAVSTALAGAIIGMLQNRLLRRVSAKSRLWIGANAVALAPCIILIGVALFLYPGLAATLPVWIIIPTVGVACAGTITAAALARLLRERSPVTSDDGTPLAHQQPVEEQSEQKPDG